MEKLLMMKLELLREEMNRIALEKGITNPQVLLLSQEIDNIHNQLNELKVYRSSRENKRNRIKEAMDEGYTYYSPNSFILKMNLLRARVLKSEVLV